MQLTLEEAREYKRCSGSVVFFTRNYVHIKHITKGKIRWKPYPGATTDPCWQIRLLSMLQDGLNLIMLKSRQVGASWTVAIFVAWLITFKPDLEILLLSQKERKAIKLLGKVKFVINNLPDWMRREASSDTLTKFSLIHRRRDGRVSSESMVDSLTTTSESGRGDTASLVFLDEFARLDDAEETWTALKPTTAHGGQIVSASSPKGKVGPFARLWMQADSGDSATFIPFRVHYTDCGFDQDWLLKASDGMTESQVAQEFELMFLGTGSPAFNPLDVQDCYIDPEDLPDDIKALIEENTTFATGVDSAEIRRGSKRKERDANAITSLTVHGIQIAAEQNKMLLDEWAGKTIESGGERLEILGYVSKWHKDFPGMMFIEENGAGLTVDNRHILPDDDVSEVYVKRTTSKSKPRLVNQFNLALAGRLVIITDKPTFYQLTMYEDLGSGRFSAPEGWNDDAVIAILEAYDALLRMGGKEFQMPAISSSGAVRILPALDNSFDPNRVNMPAISEFMPAVMPGTMMDAFDDLDPRSIELAELYEPAYIP